MTEQTLILGVIGSDSHAVGITILDHALTEAGFNVINLGVQASQEDFLQAARKHSAGAVLVSSVYGHAKQDTEGFIDLLEGSDLDAVTYIGGNLSVGQEPFEEAESRFRERGFDRVFDPTTNPEDVIETLTEDLGVDEDNRVNQKI